MRFRWRDGLIVAVLGVAGCVDGEFRDPFANRSPAGKNERGLDPSSAPAASTKTATRVDAVAKAVIADAGADLPDKPVFSTLGVTEPMIFHRGTGQVVLSEGLVERCATDADLAAIICHELGKVAAARADKESARPSGIDLSPAPRLSSDVVGSGHSADMTRVAEEAMLSRRAPRDRETGRPARPDARTLARNLFNKTGHDAEHFTRVEPLYREAEENAENREVMRGR